jgi:hypothetical protein
MNFRLTTRVRLGITLHLPTLVFKWAKNERTERHLDKRQDELLLGAPVRPGIEFLNGSFQTPDRPNATSSPDPAAFFGTNVIVFRINLNGNALLPVGAIREQSENS